MTRSLGVNCSTTYVFVGLAIDGELVDVGPNSRLGWPGGSEETERLDEMLEDLRTMLRELRPSSASILLPEHNRKGSQYLQLRARIALETLVQLACVQLEVKVGMLSRPTLRAQLGLPRTGKLSDLVEEKVTPVGPYWTTGRSLASAIAIVEND